MIQPMNTPSHAMRAAAVATVPIAGTRRNPANALTAMLMPAIFTHRMTHLIDVRAVSIITVLAMFVFESALNEKIPDMS